MSKKNITLKYQAMTSFLRGQASRIFNDVSKNDDIVIVLKNSKPQNVIISYERYVRLKEKGEEI